MPESKRSVAANWPNNKAGSRYKIIAPPAAAR